MLAWMEKAHQSIPVRIAARQVRPLEQIAMVAGQGQVRSIIRSAMLTRNDVLHMIRVERFPLLAYPLQYSQAPCAREMTIFRTVSGKAIRLPS